MVPDMLWFKPFHFVTHRISAAKQLICSNVSAFSGLMLSL